VFIGTYLPKLDDKGRVILPAKFRDELSSGLVITRGQDRSLFVFSQREFEAMAEKLRAAPVTGKQGRDYLRLFLSGASQEALDSQNRLTIPANLRDYAGIERDLTVIGVGSRVEIWDTESWNTYYSANETDYSNTAEEVIPGLF
jgi:MraZ protein